MPNTSKTLAMAQVCWAASIRLKWKWHRGKFPLLSQSCLRFKNSSNLLPHVATSSIWPKTSCLITTNTSNPAAYPLLDELAQALQQTKVEHIEIAGHQQQRQRRLQSAPIPSTRSSRCTSFATTPQCQPSLSPRSWRSTTCRSEWSGWCRQPKQPSAQSTCRNIGQNPVIDFLLLLLD